MQNSNTSGVEDKFAMNFGNFDTEGLFNATHMGGINLGCKRSAHDAGLDDELGISSDDEDIEFEPTKKDGRMLAHSSRDNNLDPKNVLLPNGKKTKGRVKIKMEFIDNKLRRYTTFSKRKTGIMKKAYELSTLTGTQVMLLVASETGHVYTFATRKLQPMITSEAGKALIQTCLNSPDPPQVTSSGHQLDQRMSATGYEETELTYAVPEEEQKGLDFADEYMNGGGSSCSGSDSSSAPTPSLSPAHTPLSSFTTGSSNGIHQGSLPLHLGQGLMLASSGAQGGSMLMGGPGGLMFPNPGNLVYTPSSQEGGGPSLLLNLPQGIQLAQDLDKKKASQMVSLPMNLISAANAALNASCSLNQLGATCSSMNQSLPTDLSLHIKREDNHS